MASYTTQTEGHSTTRPPFFNGDNYPLWKKRMSVYIQGSDTDLWITIKNGPFIPSKIEESKKIFKPEEEWTDLDKRKVELDAKAKSIFYCALGDVELERIMTCETAKEIWDTLQTVHEGTSEVKLNKIDMHVRTYEMFRMETNESITSMFTRFTFITNSLQSLGKILTNEEKVRKILRSLPQSWQPMVTAIKQSKVLGDLDLKELQGTLLTHEMDMKGFEIESTTSSKPRGLALVADQGESDDDGEIALLTRKFKQYLKKKSGRFERKGEVTCFKCNKPGHMQRECPLNKSRDHHEKKAHKAILDDSSSDEDFSDDESNERANLCLMARMDEQVSNHSQDIYSAFQELYDRHVLVVKKHKSLKLDYEKLLKENETLQGTINKLNKGSSSLNDLLNVQKHADDRTGLGYSKKQHASVSTPAKFVKPTSHVEDSNESMRSVRSEFSYDHDRTTSTCRAKKNDRKMPKAYYQKDQNKPMHSCTQRFSKNNQRNHKHHASRVHDQYMNKPRRTHSRHTHADHLFRKKNPKRATSSHMFGNRIRYNKLNHPASPGSNLHSHKRIIQVWVPKKILTRMLD